MGDEGWVPRLLTGCRLYRRPHGDGTGLLVGDRWLPELRCTYVQNTQPQQRRVFVKSQTAVGAAHGVILCLYTIAAADGVHVDLLLDLQSKPWPSFEPAM